MTEVRRAPLNVRREIAYLVNLYPYPTHTFIRREIRALEIGGWQVHAFSHRASEANLPDPDDAREMARTTVLTAEPTWRVARAVSMCAAAGPMSFAAAMFLAMRLATDGSYWKHFGYFVLACVLTHKLSKLACSHIHAHFGTNSAAVACIASRLSGIPYSVVYHGIYEFEAPGRRIKIERAKFIVAISKLTRNQLREAHPDHAHKILLIRCGLDPEWLNSKRPAPSAEPILVSIARLSEHKNPALLLSAAEKLRQRQIPFQLEMIGDGPLRMEVEREISRRGLQRQITLLGWCSRAEIQQHLGRARALVLSSSSEGLPVAIMEAFALGRCAIATNVGAVSELVQTGDSGWLVPKDDADALAHAMEECLRASSADLSRLGESARQRVEPWTIEASVSLLIDALMRDNGETISSTIPA